MTPEVLIPDYSKNRQLKHVSTASFPPLLLSRGMKKDVTHQDDRVNQLTSQNFLQLVTKSSIIPRLLHNHVPTVQDVERRVDTRDIGISLGRVSRQSRRDSTEWRLGADLGPLCVGEVDAREDG